MGQIVYALIEHSLTPEEILAFPKKLETCQNSTIAGRWAWSDPNLNVDSLFKFWTTKQIDLSSTYSWGPEDFPWLEKENFTLYFFEPNLIVFDCLFKWLFFSKNETRIREFSALTREIGSLVNATDLLFVPELTDNFINAHDNLTVDLFRQDAKKRYEAAIEVR